MEKETQFKINSVEELQEAYEHFKDEWDEGYTLKSEIDFFNSNKDDVYVQKDEFRYVTLSLFDAGYEVVANPIKNQEKLYNPKEHTEHYFTPSDMDVNEQIGKLPTDFLHKISKANSIDIKDSINKIVYVCYNNAYKAGWHTDIDTGELKDINIGEKLALIHSEVSEAMEGARKDLMDDHLPHRKMEEVELADAVIRIFDLSGRRGWDLGGAIEEKLEYNKNRSDHKITNRKKDNGKKF